LLASDGFRDLVDDARGVLVDLVSHPPPLENSSGLVDLGLTDIPYFEISQLTGAICPIDDGVYRPGLWIVLRDMKAAPKQSLPEMSLEHARVIVEEFTRRLGIS